jgi:hypothetical protein
LLAIEPVCLGLGRGDVHVDGRAGASLGELPDDVDGEDLAGDDDPPVGLVGSQFLRHREVRVAGRT